LSTANIGTVSSTGSLNVTAANTGENITIGSMEGTLDGAHLVNLTVTNLSGTATVGALITANIGTVSSTGSINVTAANTGENITIRNMERTLDGAHLANQTDTHPPHAAPPI